MVVFNVEGTREKDMLKSFDDIQTVLTFLYINRNNYIEYDDAVIVMDCDGNLLVRPKEVNFQPVKESTNDLFYVCKNDMSYIEMMNIIDELKKTGEFDKIKVQVAAAKNIKFS